MEQITKKDGIYYYGEQPCNSVDDAYRRFRDDYHAGLGKRVYHRLDRLGQRTERVHEHGFVFDTDAGSSGDEFSGLGKVCCRLSLVLFCYCRIIGLYDFPDISDEQFERWLDWVFSKGSGALRVVGTRDKTGRTSKRLKTRYR